MENFLPPNDDVSRLINNSAQQLYERLKKLDVHNLGIPPHCLEYFLKSHINRLFFSIETSAHLLNRALRRTGKRVEEVVLMDYGAGVGTLYLLARLVGCRVVYNDLLEDWKKSGQLVAEACGIAIEKYIIGDIDATLEQLNQIALKCDIIASRNVIEHIYKLDHFYSSIHKQQPGTIVFSSTTANYYNPAMHLQHVKWHRKCEKRYMQDRANIILKIIPGIQKELLAKLSRATRGLAVKDLDHAIKIFDSTLAMPDPAGFYTNTCDPANGVWAENLLTFKKYRQLIGENRYRVSFLPGFWDTHYKSAIKNRMAVLFNRIIQQYKKPAFRLAPFIYIIAYPVDQNLNK
ncbi:MAG TPA: hypothetical protein VM012_01850 [Flavitalea sp.]|nr:hypothetical protein [Flavitalea sp.]